MGTAQWSNLVVLLSVGACNAEPEPAETGDSEAESPTESGVDETDDSGGDTEPVAATIDLGPMSGAVTDQSARIWTRLTGAGDARVVYATDDAFSDPSTSDWAEASAESDFTMWWQLDGLQADTMYWYVVVAGDEEVDPQDARTFRTAPEPGTNATFRFVVFSDAQATGPSESFASAAAENPAFAMTIGDYDHRNPADTLPIDIENWRQMHRDILGHEAFGVDMDRDILKRMPMYHMWDDHDYGDDNAHLYVEWRDISTQSMREYWLFPELPNPTGGFWYSFRYAQAEIFMLDLRSQRDPQAGDDDGTKSMLDGEGIPNGQKEWFKQALLDSTATWKFVVSTSVWNPHSKEQDSWFCYPTEQQELIDFIQSNGIEGVIVLSGDIHSGGGIDDGTNSTFPEVTVPTTNMGGGNCTGECGSWSEGILNEQDRAGYALVTVTHEPSSETPDQLRLEVKDRNGVLNIGYDVAH